MNIFNFIQRSTEQYPFQIRQHRIGKLLIGLTIGSMVTLSSCRDRLEEAITPLVDQGAAKEAAATTPTITAITGVQSSSISVRYLTHWVADTDGTSTLTITGANFGTKAGTVSLKNGGKFSVSIKTWENTKIVVKVNTAFGNNALTTDLVITTSDGKTVSKSLSLQPRVNGFTYGQCTFHTNDQVGLAGKIPQASGTAYTLGVVLTTTTYVPQVSDILIYGTAHQAYVASVTAQTPKKNADGSTDYTYQYTATDVDGYADKATANPVVKSYVSTVVIRVSKTGVRSVLSGTWRCYLNKSDATRYYRPTAK